MNENNIKNWAEWVYFDRIILGDKFVNINLGYIGTKMGFKLVTLQNIFIMDKDNRDYVIYK